MGRTKKNIKLRIPEKPRKIKGFRLGSYRVATTISSQPRYDRFDTAACHGVYHTILSAGVQLLFLRVYFDAAAHVLMGEGGRLWRSGC